MDDVDVNQGVVGASLSMFGVRYRVENDTEREIPDSANARYWVVGDRQSEKSICVISNFDI